MKRLFVLMLALTMLVLAACGSPAGTPTPSNAPTATPTPSDTTTATAPPAEVRTLKLAEIHPDGYPTVLGCQMFADLVREKTNGTINIEVFNNGVLGDEKTTVEQTQMGDIHFVRVGVNVLSPLNPKMNALGMPYLYRDTAHCFSVLDGPIGEEFRQSLTDQGLLGLCWYDSGSRNFYNRTREVHSPEDMQGLKIRVQETKLMVGLVEGLGASATPMALGEVYSGIQNGVVDGAENNWPSYITTAHVEVAPFITVDQHTRAPEMILMNYDTWNSFSAEEQAIIREAALESAVYQREEWLRQEETYKNEAITKGATVTELTPDNFQKFVDAMNALYSDPDYAQYSDVYEAIRNTQ